MKLPKNLKYKTLTFGCQMNKSDSERIDGLLLDMGMKEAGRAEEADIVILNTCSVRQTAEDRVYGLIRNFNLLKRQKPHFLIAVTGCVAGRDKDGAIRKKLQGNPPSNSPLKKGGEVGSGVDFFFPISDLPRLPEMINKKLQSLRGVYSRRGNLKNNEIATAFSLAMTEKNKMDYLGVKPNAKEWWRGFVVIQTGCSNYCTYCVVPYARGHEKNRPIAAILKEARQMIKNGAREIQLLGQTVNSHPKFVEILQEINKIPGINRVSFASAHPMYMTDEIIKTLKLPKMMNYLHLPVQSGNDEILKKMNRNYTVKEYLKVIHRIKKACPDMALATDIIVGFPGETKRQFADTLSLYKECDFDLSYNAMYSPRTGTAAFRAFKDDVPHEEKRRRWVALQKMMEKNALRKNKKFVSQVVEVLVDGCMVDRLPSNHSLIRANRRMVGRCYGFSREYKRVIFTGDKSLVGQVVNVKIEKTKEWEMEGKISSKQ